MAVIGSRQKTKLQQPVDHLTHAIRFQAFALWHRRLSIICPKVHLW